MSRRLARRRMPGGWRMVGSRMVGMLAVLAHRGQAGWSAAFLSPHPRFCALLFVVVRHSPFPPPSTSLTAPPLLVPTGWSSGLRASRPPIVAHEGGGGGGTCTRPCMHAAGSRNGGEQKIFRSRWPAQRHAVPSTERPGGGGKGEQGRRRDGEPSRPPPPAVDGGAAIYLRLVASMK